MVVNKAKQEPVYKQTNLNENEYIQPKFSSLTLYSIMWDLSVINPHL